MLRLFLPSSSHLVLCICICICILYLYYLSPSSLSLDFNFYPLCVSFSLRPLTYTHAAIKEGSNYLLCKRAYVSPPTAAFTRYWKQGLPRTWVHSDIYLDACSVGMTRIDCRILFNFSFHCESFIVQYCPLSNLGTIAQDQRRTIAKTRLRSWRLAWLNCHECSSSKRVGEPD